MIAPDTLLQNRYLIQEQIGQGGMGAVYIATDQRFGSTVALKETFFDDAAMRRAFEREARLLNHLRHPALPRVSDYFTDEQGEFLVMEFIPGEDLFAKLKERRAAFPISEVLNWADQLLDALDYLHTQEPPVIHRDIKPQNLKLTPKGQIVLLDFGLAKGAPNQSTSMMTSRSVFGFTPNFAPLEQIQGTGTDPRSDIYSLGATLYYLMTGTPPPDTLSRATAVLNAQPDPLHPANEVHVQVSPGVAQVIQSAMAQNASQRPQTAAAMREALREAARLGHNVARDTNLQPIAATNLYEQDTQLIYGASANATAGGAASNQTGAIKKEGTATDATIAKNKVSSTSTNVKNGDSVVTKVAKADEAKSRKRGRNLAIAASAIVLVALAAVVYTLTRDKSQTPVSNENINSVTIAPTPGNTNVQTSATPTESPVTTVDAKPTPIPETRHANTPANPPKENPQPKPTPKEEKVQSNPPSPPNIPNSNETNEPSLRPRRLPPGMTEEEAQRIRDERRQAREEQRQAVEEQRKTMILRRIMRQRQRQQ
jgi:eukaryotic-like serine/threonine-protein kinase